MSVVRSNRLRFSKIIGPRLDRPLPLWMIFPVVFMALYASHFTLLRLPVLLGRGGLLHSRGMGLLPHRLAHPHHARSPTPIRRCPASTSRCGGRSAASIPKSRAKPCSWWPRWGFSPSGGWPCASSESLRSPSGPCSSPASIPSGSRKARSPMPTSLPPRARCGDWSTRCPAAAANRGLPRCGFPPPRYARKLPSPSPSRWPRSI